MPLTKKRIDALIRIINDEEKDGPLPVGISLKLICQNQFSRPVTFYLAEQGETVSLEVRTDTQTYWQDGKWEYNFLDKRFSVKLAGGKVFTITFCDIIVCDMVNTFLTEVLT